MIRVLEINDPESLANHRLVWSKLLPLTPRGTFFQSLDWLLAFWHHHGAWLPLPRAHRLF